MRLGVTYRSATLTVDGFIVNLSQGGIFVETSQHDPPGTVAELSLETRISSPLILRGHVAWSTDTGMALSFDNLSRKDRRDLANILLKHHRL